MDGKKEFDIRAEKRISDMTSGDPKRLIFRFMLPVIGGNLLQQLYTVVDAAIVGQGVGVDALAAIGATDWIYWFMLWAAAGFGQGFSVVIASAFGEKDLSKLKKSINMSIAMSIAVGAMLAAIGIIFAEPVLRLLSTPENIFDYALTYISIMYGGIFIMTVYNNLAGVLRALGDSRSPFVGLIISTAMNIGLDLLFVMVFHWGIGGAAVATVISQAAAGSYCFLMFRRISMVRSEREEWRFDGKTVKELWNKGAATAFQYAIIAVGGIVVQFGLNNMGFLYVAGFTATNKLYGILEAVSLAMGSAMMIYTSQNYGAGNRERIKAGTRISLVFGAVVSVSLGIIMITLGRYILMLFIDQSSDMAEDVMDIAYRYLFNMSLFLIILYIINTYRNIVMALNKMSIVVLSSGMEFAGRVVMTVLTLTLLGTGGVYFIEVVAWTFSAVILFPAYYIIMGRMK